MGNKQVRIGLKKFSLFRDSKVYSRISLILLFVCWVLFSSVAAQTEDSNANADAHLSKARAAQQAGDQRKRDFWLARFMGEVRKNSAVTRSFADAQDLFTVVNQESPSCQLSGKFSAEFWQWFVKRSQEQWGVLNNMAVERDHNFEMANGEGNISEGYLASYFSALFISPQIVTCQVNAQLEVLAISQVQQEPFLLSGKMVPGEYTMYFRNIPFALSGYPLLAVWAPKYADIDGDKIPEAFYRYNVLTENSFDQELTIYKFEGDLPKFFKKFVASDGGIARKIDGKKIQVAQGNSLGGQLVVETLEYDGRDFVVVDRETIENPFVTEEWKQYYFDHERLF